MSRLLCPAVLHGDLAFNDGEEAQAMSDRLDVFDLIVSVMLEHEKKLDELVERLERATDKVLERWK